jgi:phosphodiesterase/alkaline phosphatase D-like protein
MDRRTFLTLAGAGAATAATTAGLASPAGARGLRALAAAAPAPRAPFTLGVASGDPAPDPIKAESPHWKFIDNQRGYLLCDLDRHRWLTDLRVVSTVQGQQATVATFARFVVHDGLRGVALA